MAATETPFDLTQLYEATEKAPAPSEPTFVNATDGVRLAVRVYKPPHPTSSRAILVFYHGGGAHSGAGYHILARNLADEHGIEVYTPDLRGHGESEGPRGDSPSPTQVYRDIDTVVAFARKHTNSDDVPLFLGGHSSGAGLMIQYATVHSQETRRDVGIRGYLLVSPQLGPNAGVSRDGSSASSFADVSVLPFILNGIFGVMGHNAAVRFRYSENELAKDGVVAYNTVNMANAVSPTAPAKQLEEMAASEMPIELWMGEKDELFDAQKVKELFPATVIVAEERHIGILVRAHKFLGEWLGGHLGHRE